KVKFFIVWVALTVGFLWLLLSWFNTLYDTYALTDIVKLSVGNSLGGVIGIGLVIHAWSMFFTVMKTGKATKYSWSKRKVKLQNRIMLFFFVVGFIVTAITYVIVNDRLLSEGYSVKTKYTNMGIYKTYTKE
ncbi:hypothetical protein UB39_22000, partial [Photobacterium angustum]